MGLISQHKGGLGIGISNLRHSAISGAGMASGVMPVCRIIDRLIDYVDQTGSRRGAATVHLKDWHIDLSEFMEGTNNFGQSQRDRFAYLNTCIWVSDLFMKHVKTQKPWYTFCPATNHGLNKLYGEAFENAYLDLVMKCEKHEQELENAKAKYEKLQLDSIHDSSLIKEKVQVFHDLAKLKKERIVFKRHENAYDLLMQMTSVQIKSGMPYIMYPDSINLKSNQINIGVVEQSNLCTEIVEHTSKTKIASCNLSSLSLKAFCNRLTPEQRYNREKHGDFMTYLKETNVFNFSKLAEMTQEVTNNLNHVIDFNFYPVPDKTEKYNKEARPLGIGVSGLDDVFKKLDLLFESEEANVLNRCIFSCMYNAALVASNKLAYYHGEPYAYFKDSPISKGKFQFDLWKEEEEIYLKKQDLLNEKVYDPAMNEPVEPWWDFSCPWDTLRANIMKHGTYNSMLLTCMPTASTAHILRNTESTECHTKNIYSRDLQSGIFFVINEHLYHDLEEIGLKGEFIYSFLKMTKGSMKGFDIFMEKYEHIPFEMRQSYLLNKERVLYLIKKYKTMFEISQQDVMRKARERAIYIDQTQSMNLFFKNPTPKLMIKCHMYSHELRLKTGIYYLRQDDVKSNDNFSLSLNPALIKFYKENLMDKKVSFASSPDSEAIACRLNSGPGECLSCS